MSAVLIEVVYRHVHDCRAGREGRACLFEWAAHAKTVMCRCAPEIDETNMMLDGQVFVVHKGVC